MASRPARRTRRYRCWPTSSAATILLGVFSAVAFATILAVVAGLTITVSSSFAHDFYANASRGNESASKEVRVARYHRGRDRRVSIVLAGSRRRS